jgi:hypothetical protein
VFACENGIVGFVVNEIEQDQDGAKAESIEGGANFFEGDPASGIRAFGRNRLIDFDAQGAIVVEIAVGRHVQNDGVFWSYVSVFEGSGEPFIEISNERHVNDLEIEARLRESSTHHAGVMGSGGVTREVGAQCVGCGNEQSSSHGGAIQKRL